MARILIVEDEALVAAELEDRLAGLGHEVTAWVDNAEAALAAVRADRPDLVILDIRIQGSLDGVELAGRLDRLPFIYLTAHADPATLARAGQTQPLGYVIKPFMDRELLAAIELALARHQGQLREQRERLALERAQRLDTLGLLAAGVAHDFNNLLAVIGGNATLCQEAEEADRQVFLHEIGVAVTRAAQLCSQMLTYAGHGPLERRRLNLSELAAVTLKAVASTHSEVDFRMAPGSSPAWMEGDSNQLRQLLLNLLVNAVEAGSRRVEVVVRSGPEGVWLSVQDDGSGVPPEIQSSIFEPFFTTRAHGRGLGLAALAGVVRCHNGRIELHSRPGQGSLFRIQLPGAAPLAEPAPSPAPPPAAGLGSRVLVVDDEEALRDLLARVLARQGYRVDLAANGEQALQMAQNGGYDLMVLDITMPGLGGREVLASTRQFQPVLMISGYDQDTADVEGVDFLAKPFDLREFVRRVAQLAKTKVAV